MKQEKQDSLTWQAISIIGIMAGYSIPLSLFIQIKGNLDSLEILTMAVVGISLLTFSILSIQRNKTKNFKL
jgi:hypothetical protein